MCDQASENLLSGGFSPFYQRRYQVLGMDRPAERSPADRNLLSRSVALRHCVLQEQLEIGYVCGIKAPACYSQCPIMKGSTRERNVSS